MAAANTISGSSDFRRANAIHFIAYASAAGSAGVAIRSLASTQKADGHAASSVHQIGPAKLVAPRNGRFNRRNTDFRRSLDADHFHRPPIESGMGRSKNGRDFTAAVDPGSVGEFRGDAGRKNSGESQLYAFDRSDRVVRSPMRDQNG